RCSPSSTPLATTRNFIPFRLWASLLPGLLIIPFAGYINRRLRGASRLGANIGTVAFANGAIWLTPAGLIVSQSHHGTSSLPRLHETCARTAALCLGTGLIAFCMCALKGYFIHAD